MVDRIPDSLALYRGAGFLVDRFGLELDGMFKIFGQSASSYMAFVMSGPFDFGKGCVGGGPVCGFGVFFVFLPSLGLDSSIGLSSFMLACVDVSCFFRYVG